MTKISDKGLLFAHSNDANPVQSTFRQHMHNEYEMLYFIAGDADYVVGSSVYHLRPNDLLFIRPATYHYLKLLSAAVVAVFLSVPYWKGKYFSKPVKKGGADRA